MLAARSRTQRRCPCPLAADRTLSLNTAELPNGAHSVHVALIDAAGNRTLSDPVPIVTRNGGAPNGKGASRFARLRGWFESGVASAPPARFRMGRARSSVAC